MTGRSLPTEAEARAAHYRNVVGIIEGGDVVTYRVTTGALKGMEFLGVVLPHTPMFFGLHKPLYEQHKAGRPVEPHDDYALLATAKLNEGMSFLSNGTVLTDIKHLELVDEQLERRALYQKFFDRCLPEFPRTSYSVQTKAGTVLVFKGVDIGDEFFGLHAPLYNAFLAGEPLAVSDDITKLELMSLPQGVKVDIHGIMLCPRALLTPVLESVDEPPVNAASFGATAVFNQMTETYNQALAQGRTEAEAVVAAYAVRDAQILHSMNDLNARANVLKQQHYQMILQELGDEPQLWRVTSGLLADLVFVGRLTGFDRFYGLYQPFYNEVLAGKIPAEIASFDQLTEAALEPGMCLLGDGTLRALREQIEPVKP